MAHTPGPWSADYGDFAAYCETGAEVCEVTRGRHDDGSRIPDDEMEANLNLVAAAPDLLEVAKELLMLRCLGGSTPSNDSATQRAVHVIAKATGNGGE